MTKEADDLIKLARIKGAVKGTIAALEKMPRKWHWVGAKLEAYREILEMFEE
jgi:hypothetical protein